MKKGSLLQLSILSIGMLLTPCIALAHRSGCHTLHTCPSDSDTYACGDLGYACDGTNSINDVTPASVNVPLLTETVFKQIFGRDITLAESTYWKNRYRTDKNSLTKIRTAMRYHYSLELSSKENITKDKKSVAPRINALFRSVYNGRNPTPSENRYWLTRIQDKPFAAQLIGAMAWHRDRNIRH